MCANCEGHDTSHLELAVRVIGNSGSALVTRLGIQDRDTRSLMEAYVVLNNELRSLGILMNNSELETAIGDEDLEDELEDD